LYTPGKTSRSVTHPEIALGQARLTPEFFAGGLPKKKVYLGGMSTLPILLSLEPGYHSFKERSWDGLIFTAVSFATKIIYCKQWVSSFIPDKGVVATK
jgi:hypothetical protein